MAWIESHQELARHPKTKKFARQANLSIPAAVGHLHMLWWWAMDYAQDGNLSSFDPEDIADAMLWEGSPEELLSALINSGFIERVSDGLYIHDWDDYAGRLIDKRKQNTERKRKSRSSHARQLQDGQAGHGATEPDLTVPNQIITTTTTGDESEIITPLTQEPYFKAYERVNARMLTPYQSEQLGKYIDDEGFEEAVIVRAIERAGITSHDLKLILKILNDYATVGAKSVPTAIIFDQEFDARTRASPDRRPSNNRQTSNIAELRRKREEAQQRE
jgi:DnaD/phage-associated family protein